MNLENDIKRGKELEAKARPPYGGLVELSRLTPKERKEYREICKRSGLYARPRIAINTRENERIGVQWIVEHMTLLADYLEEAHQEHASMEFPEAGSTKRAMDMHIDQEPNCTYCAAIKRARNLAEMEAKSR